MKIRRRGLVKQGLGMTFAAAGAASLTAGVGCSAQEKGAAKMTVGPCGLCCDACPLMAAGKCKGCNPQKKCPVVECACMKKIAYCGKSCKMFADCGKLVGRPYDKAFLAKIKSKLG
jgi:hypothetical protein